MTTPQSAIIPDAGAFALYVQMNIVEDVMAVISELKQLPTLVAQLNVENPEASLNLSIAFSSERLSSLNQAVPEELHPFTSFDSKNGIFAPATQADVLIHCHSNRHDLHFYLLSKLLSNVAGKVKIMDETYGYRFLDSRDMTGFIDGTENPNTDELRREVAVIKDGPFAGGSFVMAQRFEHKLPGWNALSVQQQEAKIGRTKLDSVELDDVPKDSHVGRVDIKEEGKGLKIVRHSLPYGSVSSKHGLLFLAYCNNMHNIKTMLDSMYGVTDGVTDQLLNYTQAVTGAYYFAPSLEMLEQLGSE